MRYRLLPPGASFASCDGVTPELKVDDAILTLQSGDAKTVLQATKAIAEGSEGAVFMATVWEYVNPSKGFSNARFPSMVLKLFKQAGIRDASATARLEESRLKNVLRQEPVIFGELDVPASIDTPKLTFQYFVTMPYMGLSLASLAQFSSQYEHCESPQFVCLLLMVVNKLYNLLQDNYILSDVSLDNILYLQTLGDESNKVNICDAASLVNINKRLGKVVVTRRYMAWRAVLQEGDLVDDFLEYPNEMGSVSCVALMFLHLIIKMWPSYEAILIRNPKNDSCTVDLSRVTFAEDSSLHMRPIFNVLLRALGCMVNEGDDIVTFQQFRTALRDILGGTYRNVFVYACELDAMENGFLKTEYYYSRTGLPQFGEGSPAAKAEAVRPPVSTPISPPTFFGPSRVAPASRPDDSGIRRCCITM